MSETAIAVEEGNGLFNGDEYKVPFPEVDGRDRTELVLSFAGSIAFNRNNPEHAELFQRLTLGRMVTLSVIAQVAGKRDLYKIKADSEGVESEELIHSISLRIHKAESSA